MSLKPPSASNVPTSISSDVASVEELVAGIYVPAVEAVSSTRSYPVFEAPFACEIRSAALTEWASGESVAASDTNYWTVAVARYRAAVSATIATKTTKVTGGEAMAARTAWTFDSVTFDPTNRVLQAGDFAAFVFTKTGTPNALDGCFMQIRYVPT